MDDKEKKDFFRNTFNTVSDGYDNAAMRFFPDTARRIVSRLNLTGDENVLDVATGTGNVALALAGDLPRGKVTGIDFSTGMLQQAGRKKTEAGATNLTFVEMDMQNMDFDDDHFDIAVSAFSIFFVEDMTTQLRHISSKVKQDGKVLVTTFFENAFSPMVGLFLERLEIYGVEVPSLAWKRVASPRQCETLFNEAGLCEVRSEAVECGYYLSSAADWWHIIWNGGFRGLVEQLAPGDLEKFRQEHLEEVQDLSTDRGVWLEMNVLYTSGIKGS